VAAGPPDDFNEQPTQHAKYGMGGSPPPAAPSGPPPTPAPEPPPAPGQFEAPEFLDPLDEEAEFTAWYRKPVVLIGWGLFVAILIGLIVYGIIELIHDNNGTTNNPSTSTTIPSTTTSTTTPPTTATTTTAPPTSSAVQAPAHQPTQQQPAQQQPTHRHHLPQLPSVITIPEVPTVITVPPELR
jgi:cytoskeletal protein RodZ